MSIGDELREHHRNSEPASLTKICVSSIIGGVICIGISIATYSYPVAAGICGGIGGLMILGGAGVIAYRCVRARSAEKAALPEPHEIRNEDDYLGRSQYYEKGNAPTISADPLAWKKTNEQSVQVSQTSSGLHQPANSKTETENVDRYQDMHEVKLH